MKVECQTEHFRAAFNIAGAVVPARTTSPIIQNVKLQADKTGVTLLGTDYEIGIRQKVSEAVVVNAGETLLPRARLGDILREVNWPDMTIEVRGTKVILTAGRASWNLPTSDAALFPPCDDFAASDYWIAPSDQIRKCLIRTAYAVAQAGQHKNPAFTGVNIDFEGGLINFAGSDDRRTSVAAVKFETHGTPVLPTVHWRDGQGREKTGPLSIIAPTKLVSLITRSIGDSESPMKIAASKSALTLQNDTTTIYGRLVEGRYVNYRRVIRDASRVEIDLPVTSFHQAIRQSMTVKTQFTRGVFLDFRKGMLTIRANSDEGEFVVEMPVPYDKEDIEIELDPQFVSDYMNHVEAQVVSVGIENSEMPLEFKTPGYLGLIAPYSKDEEHEPS